MTCLPEETKDSPQKIVTKIIPSNVNPAPVVIDLSGNFSNLRKRKISVSDEVETNHFSEQKSVTNPAPGPADSQNILKERSLNGNRIKCQPSKNELESEIRLINLQHKLESQLEKKLEEVSKEKELIKENEIKQNFIIMKKERELKKIQAEKEEIQQALLDDREIMARELEKMKAMLKEKEEQEIQIEREKEELLKQKEQELLKQKELQIPCFEGEDEVNICLPYYYTFNFFFC